MKDSPLKDRFEKAQQAYRQYLAEWQGDYFLDALQEAVTSLQELGLRTSLEVRPRLLGSTHVMQGREALANATVTSDGFETQWVLSKSNSFASVDLSGFVGDSRVANFTINFSVREGGWTKPELIHATTLADAITNVLIDNIAGRNAVAKYNTGNGIAPAKPLRQLKG